MNKSYLIIALVAVAAIVAVVLVIFKVINIGGCPEGQSSCGSACCQPDETCQDGACQPKPHPDPSLDCKSPKKTCGRTDCCEDSQCFQNRYCCQPGEIVCGQTCCLSGRCNNQTCECNDDDHRWVENQCCLKTLVTTDNNRCCDATKPPCGSDCCETDRCKSDSTCCAEGFKVKDNECVQACGDFLCGPQSACATLNGLKDCVNLGMPKCDDTTTENCWISCEASQEDGTKTVKACLPRNVCAYDLPVSEFPAALNSFYPVYDFSNMQQGILKAHADEFKGRNGSIGSIFRDVISFSRNSPEVSQLGDFKNKVRSYAEKLDPIMRTSLNSPIGYACLGKGQTGFRWEFYRPHSESTTCGPADCLKLASVNGKVLRVQYEDKSQICALELCEGENCTYISDADPSKAQNSSDFPLCSDDFNTACNASGIGHQSGKECILNDMIIEGHTDGMQLWEPNSRKLYLTVADCESLAVPFGKNLWIKKADGSCDNDGDAIKKGQNMDSRTCKLTSKDATDGDKPLDAFEWWKNRRAASLCVTDNSTSKNVDNTTASMLDPPGGSKERRTCENAVIEDYASSLSMHYNGCMGSCGGSVEQQPDC